MDPIQRVGCHVCPSDDWGHVPACSFEITADVANVVQPKDVFSNDIDLCFIGSAAQCFRGWREVNVFAECFAHFDLRGFAFDGLYWVGCGRRDDCV